MFLGYTWLGLRKYAFQTKAQAEGFARLFNRKVRPSTIYDSEFTVLL